MRRIAPLLLPCPSLHRSTRCLFLFFLVQVFACAGAGEDTAGRGSTARQGPSIIGLQHTLPFRVPRMFLAQIDKIPAVVKSESASGHVFGAIRASFDAPLVLAAPRKLVGDWVNVTCGGVTFRGPQRIRVRRADYGALAFELHLHNKKGFVPPSVHNKLRQDYRDYFPEPPASNSILFILLGHPHQSVSLSGCSLHIANRTGIANHLGQSIASGNWSISTTSTEQTYRSSQRTVFIVELPTTNGTICDGTNLSTTPNVSRGDESNISGKPSNLFHHQSAGITEGAAGHGVITEDGRYISALQLRNLISTGTSQPPSFVDALVSAALSSNLPEVSKQLATALTDRSKATVSQKVVAQTKGDIPRVVTRFLDVALTYNLTGLVTDSVSGALPPLLAQALHESLTFGLVKPSGMFISEKIKQVVPPLLVPGIARSLSRGLPHLATRALVPRLTSALTKSITHSLAPVLGSSLTKTSSSSDVFCGQCVRTGKHCNLCHDSPQNSYYRIYYAGYYSDFFSNYYAEYYSSATKMLDLAVMEERKMLAGKLQKSGQLDKDMSTRTVGGLFKDPKK